MQLIELSAVRHRVTAQSPLPFNVRLADGTLLLARGQVVHTGDQLDALCARGMLVDIAELQTPRERALLAPAEELPALWGEAVERATRALQAEPDERFESGVEEAALPLMALVERDPDLAIFQVMRQLGSHHTQYGVNHSVHCAIAAFVTARRLDWDDTAIARAVKAALTMNISMLELQGQLALQLRPPTDAQREAIRTHPLRSAKMLAQAGIADAEWLRGVAEHHEQPDGSGYPAGSSQPCALANLLRTCDVYTTKLSPRRSREALAADAAARRLFAEQPGNPVCSALIKEFGLYPPGTFVRLASGETGVVVRRGASAHQPEVLLLTTAQGASPHLPVRRDTSRASHAVVAVLGNDAAAAAGDLEPAILAGFRSPPVSRAVA